MQKPVYHMYVNLSQKHNRGSPNSC